MLDVKVKKIMTFCNFIYYRAVYITINLIYDFINILIYCINCDVVF